MFNSATCRKEPAPGGHLSTLPLDILQRVASLMPLKDWAKASGACRVMHTLQLDVIDVADPDNWHLVGLGPRPEPERSAGAHHACPDLRAQHNA